MKKTVLSMLLTFILGPGAGHIYLKKYKKGIFLFLSVIFCTILLSMSAVAKSGYRDAEMTPDKANSILSSFTSENPNAVLIYDIICAGIWTYAFYDAFTLSRGQKS